MTKECNFVCIFKLIILLVKTIGKKLIVSVVSQNMVPFGEPLRVAGVTQVVVLTESTKLPEERAHYFFSKTRFDKGLHSGRMENYVKSSVSL